MRLTVSDTYNAPEAPLAPIKDHARSEGVLNFAEAAAPSVDPAEPPVTIVVTTPADVILRIRCAPTSEM